MASTYDSRKIWPDAVLVFLLIAIGLGVALPRYRCGINFSDEGFLAYGAVQVSEGKIPNRDFVSLQPPLSFYLVAAAFKFLGTSLASLRMLGLTFYLLVSLLSYAVVRCLAKPATAFFAAAPNLIVGMPLFLFVPFAVWQGIATTLASGWLYLLALNCRNQALAFAAGILTAAAFGLRQDQAFYFCGALIIFSAARWKLEIDNRRKALRVFAAWGCGLVVAGSGASLWWWAHGAIGDMFRQLVVFPLMTYAKTSSEHFPRLIATYPFGVNALSLFFTSCLWFTCSSQAG